VDAVVEGGRDVTDDVDGFVVALLVDSVKCVDGNVDESLVCDVGVNVVVVVLVDDSGELYDSNGGVVSDVFSGVSLIFEEGNNDD
jgi:F420-0:gamma-glutamyl ligase-like protein